KIARILIGDPNYADNWHDIQGYAKLVEERLPTLPHKESPNVYVTNQYGIEDTCLTGGSAGRGRGEDGGALRGRVGETFKADSHADGSSGHFGMAHNKCVPTPATEQRLENPLDSDQDGPQEAGHFPPWNDDRKAFLIARVLVTGGTDPDAAFELAARLDSGL